jgi:transcriptional regulator with XRE-family HTH domain
MKHQGSALKEIVLAAGFSVEELADRLEMTGRTLHYWFGAEELKPKIIDKVSNAIGVDVRASRPGVFLGAPEGGTVKVVKASSARNQETAQFWKDKYTSALEDNVRLRTEIDLLKESLGR